MQLAQTNAAKLPYHRQTLPAELIRLAWNNQTRLAPVPAT